MEVFVLTFRSLPLDHRPVLDLVTDGGAEPEGDVVWLDVLAEIVPELDGHGGILVAAGEVAPDFDTFQSPYSNPY